MPPPTPWRKDRQRWEATDLEPVAYSLLGSGRCFVLLLTCYPLRCVPACRAFSATWRRRVMSYFVRNPGSCPAISWRLSGRGTTKPLGPLRRLRGLRPNVSNTGACDWGLRRQLETQSLGFRRPEASLHHVA